MLAEGGPYLFCTILAIFNIYKWAPLGSGPFCPGHKKTRSVTLLFEVADIFYKLPMVNLFHSTWFIRSEGFIV